MSATSTIKVRCPACRAKYRIAADAVGKKLRCSQCSQVFRISQPKSSDSHTGTPDAAPAPAAASAASADAHARHGLPTEDDICRWLMEGLDEDIPARPRIANAPQDPVDSSVRPWKSNSSPSSDRSNGVQRAARSEDRRAETGRSKESSDGVGAASNPAYDRPTNRAGQDREGSSRQTLSLRKTA